MSGHYIHDGRLATGPSYSRRPFERDSLLLMVDHAAMLLRKLEADAIMGVGLSGLPLLGAISYETGIPMIAIRKPGEKHYDETPTQAILKSPEPAKRWVFVDDLIDSGATLRAAYDSAIHDGLIVSAPVGIFLYNSMFSGGAYVRATLEKIFIIAPPIFGL